MDCMVIDPRRAEISKQLYIKGNRNVMVKVIILRRKDWGRRGRVGREKAKEYGSDWALQKSKIKLYT